MNKIIPIGVLAIAAAAAAYYLVKKPGGHRTAATELVPAETILFAQLPDIQRTTQRWKATSLHQLLQEPEIQGFLERPREKFPLFQKATAISAQIQQTSPKEGFFAVTSIEGPMPEMIAGLAYSGSREQVEAVIAPWRAEIRTAHPAGRADLVTYGAWEIQTFTDKELTVAECFCDGWYFISNKLELLQRTIDRSEGKGTPQTTLGATERYQKSLAPLSEAPDAILYAELSTVKDRLMALLTASGQTPDPQQIERLKRIEAIAACTKLDGKQFRDSIFILSPGQPKQGPLAGNSLALTSTKTLLHYASALPAKIEIPETSLAAASLMIPGIGALDKALSEKGLKLNDLGAAIGPEVGGIFEWAQGAMQPSFALAIDVRDAAKAQGFVDVITSGALGTPAWEKTEEAGAAIFALPAEGLTMISPALAVTDRFIVFGLSREAVTLSLTRAATGGEKLNANPAYGPAMKSVVAATSANGYLDLGGLIERAYGTFRPILVMSLAFLPEAGQYVDAGKLPSTETLTKHLGAVVVSHATTDQGTLLESTGTLTANQAIAGILAGTITAAAPALKAALSSGMSLDPKGLFNVAPGGATPGAPADSGEEPPEPAMDEPVPSDQEPTPDESVNADPIEA